MSALHTVRKPTLTRYLEPKFTNDFFEQGKLRLSSFAACRLHEDSARLDNNEGWIHQVTTSKNSREAILALHAGATYLLCATSTESRSMENAFGTNAGFRILDPFGFVAAIADVVPGCFRTAQGPCYYRESVELRFESPHPFPDLESMAESEVVAFLEGYIPGNSDESLFVKQARYSEQNEYRFIWHATGVAQPTMDVVCPAALRYCERLASQE